MFAEGDRPRDLGAAQGSLNAGGEVLRDDQLHSWFLDRDIEVDADANRLHRTVEH